MSHIVDVAEESKRRMVNSSDKEQFNWLPKLAYFKNDFFLVAASLLILENYSKVSSIPLLCFCLSIF